MTQEEQNRIAEFLHSIAILAVQAQQNVSNKEYIVDNLYLIEGDISKIWNIINAEITL